MAAAFCPNGTIIATGSENSTAQLWNVETGKPFSPPLQHRNSVSSVAFSRDGKTVATGSWDRTARLWDAATGRPLGGPLEHSGEVRAVALSPDGETLLTGSMNKTVQLWRVPKPMDGEASRVKLWVTMITGMELDDAGAIRVLDAQDWHERRQHLEQLGGPLPMP